MKFITVPSALILTALSVLIFIVLPVVASDTQSRGGVGISVTYSALAEDGGDAGGSADGGEGDGVGDEGSGCCGDASSPSDGVDAGETNDGIGDEGPGCCTDTPDVGESPSGGDDNPPPQVPTPLCTLNADPDSFGALGGATALVWTTDHADTVVIDQGVGTVALDGTTNVTVTSSKTFTLTATGQGGTVQCSAPVVVATPNTPVCTLDVEPNSIVRGGSARVDWSSANVTHVVIKEIIGSSETTVRDTDALSGSLVVSPEQNARYTGTFTGPYGTVSCEAPLAVQTSNGSSLSCDAFTIIPSSVRDNATVTMSWSTTNAQTVSIDQGIGSVPVDGTKDIVATDDRTYTLTATRGTETVTCTASVDVTSGGGGGGGGGSSAPRCDLFKASDTKISSGQTVELRWETRRGTKLEIEPNIFETSDDDEVDEGSVTVRPTKDTKYTLTVFKGTRKDTCTVSVDVTKGITVLSTRDQLPLTSVPYTGFDAGPFLTGFFYVLLALWSMAVAYVLVVERGSVFGFSLPGAASHASGHGPAIIPRHEYAQHVERASDAAPVHATAEHQEAAHSAPSSNAPVNLPTLNGYAAYNAWQQGASAEVSDQDAIFDRLEAQAHRDNVLLSSDAMRALLDQGVTEVGAQELLTESIERAKAAYPREDGWIVLNRERVHALFGTKDHALEPSVAPVVHAERGASTLAEAIVTQNTVRAYALIDEAPMRTLADAAEDLDAVVRFRKDASVVAPDLLVRAAAHVSDDKLKSAVAALVSAIDGTYADEIAAVRLAVIKALKAVA